MRFLGLAVLLSTTQAALLPAQRIDDGRVAMHVESGPVTEPVPGALTQAARTDASTRSMILGGIIGGTLGAFAGAWTGASIENCDNAQRSENCGLAGALIGGIIGESIGVPIGVNYVANGGGNLRRSMAVSLTLTGACLVTAYQTAGASVLAMVPLQILTSVRVERSGRAGVLGM